MVWQLERTRGRVKHFYRFSHSLNRNKVLRISLFLIALKIIQVKNKEPKNVIFGNTENQGWCTL